MTARSLLLVRLVQVACVVAFVVLAVVAGYAMATADMATSFALLLNDPWGVTTVVDVNAGFVFAMAVVWLLEPRRGVCVVVTVLTPLLGNFVPLVWLAVRAARLQR